MQVDFQYFFYSIITAYPILTIPLKYPPVPQVTVPPATSILKSGWPLSLGGTSVPGSRGLGAREKRLVLWSWEKAQQHPVPFSLQQGSALLVCTAWLRGHTEAASSLAGCLVMALTLHHNKKKQKTKAFQLVIPQTTTKLRAKINMIWQKFLKF